MLKVPNETPKKKMMCFVSASPTSTLHQLSAEHAIDVLNATRSVSMHENKQCAILWSGYDGARPSLQLARSMCGSGVA